MIDFENYDPYDTVTSDNKKPTKKDKIMKEVRNANLTAKIKTSLPNVGYIEIDTKSNGRKAFFKWRKSDFVVSSRLILKELSFSRKMTKHTCETQDSVMLQKRLRPDLVTA